MNNPEMPLIEMYRTMLTIRRFEERCLQLYMQGRIPSTLHLYVGQEAVATGVCAHLGDQDYVLGTHRPHGHAIAKGVSLKSVMAELFAKDTGCCRGKGGSMHVGDMSVGVVPAIAIVGGNIPLATGMALAAKRMGKDQVAVSFFGDGAANEGAFHEGINMAAIWDLPAIFVCENNLYGASTVFSKVFRVENVADRACAYGIPGVIVDGMDVEAVYEVAGEAIERARNGGGPTLIEAKTYRFVGHSRSDPRNYRPDEEEALWKEKDPIPKLAQRLVEKDLATEATLKQVEEDVKAEIDEAVAFAEASPDPRPEDALKHLFYEQGEEA
jgi:acetoin:2,6-dichlorophenolindophenol oxidoreductase subunit alpha